MIFSSRILESLHGPSCGVCCLMISLAVLIEYRLVTDRQTYSRADSASETDTAYAALAQRRAENYLT